ncbi:flocculation protein FLO11-like [Lingula anatina]|uniref:Flocculation protein FLO11-like n=1 Tax=Lingula anatina TaxID=7574 RepID=A0A1S3IJ52_LINAN|nr:flocculation protein FLO11-like [Lingula anatina]|eukprot:XP_013398138.1 flocculation protein FLO11-like [Lingula anatina]
MCGAHSFKTKAGYLMSPNFPNKYKPNINCQCRLTSTNGENIHIQILFLSIHFQDPCTDWLKINNKKRCGFSTDVIEAPTFDLEFHTDDKEHHSGYWLYFKASGSGSVNVECDNFPIPDNNGKSTTTTTTTTKKMITTLLSKKVPTTTTVSTPSSTRTSTTTTTPTKPSFPPTTTLSTTTMTTSAMTTRVTTSSISTTTTPLTRTPAFTSKATVTTSTASSTTSPTRTTSPSTLKPTSSETTLPTPIGPSKQTTGYHPEKGENASEGSVTTASTTRVLFNISETVVFTPSTRFSTTTNATVGAIVEEEKGFTLLGWIIVCVAIVGLMLILLILGLLFWCRRKRMKNEETQTNGNASATIDVVVTSSSGVIEENCDKTRLVTNADESTQFGNGFISMSHTTGAINQALVIVENASSDGNPVASILSKAVQVNLDPDITYDDNIIIIGRAEFEIDSVANLYSRIRHKDKGIQIGSGVLPCEKDAGKATTRSGCLYEDVQLAPKAAKRSSLQGVPPPTAPATKQRKSKHKPDKQDQTEYLELPVLNVNDKKQIPQSPVSSIDHVRKRTRRGPPKRMDYLDVTVPDRSHRSNVSTDQVRKKARKDTAKRIAKLTNSQEETERKPMVSTENVKQQARTVGGRKIKAVARRRSSSSGIDICTPVPAASTIDGYTSDEYQTSISSHGMTSEDLPSELEEESSGSETSSHFETNSNRKASILSLSVVDEMVMSPETPDNSGSDSDWDKKSAISI